MINPEIAYFLEQQNSIHNQCQKINETITTEMNTKEIQILKQVIQLQKYILEKFTV